MSRNCFLVIDETQTCYIFESGKLRFNRYYASKNSKVVSVIPLKEKTLIVELNKSTETI